MPFIILMLGALILVTAYHNSFGALATELETDLVGYFKWAIAIVAILALGYIPGLRSPSRMILALVALVLVLTNYQQFFAGFSGFASAGSQPVTPTSSNTPTQEIVADPATTTPPTQGSIEGNPPAGGTATAANSNTLSPLDPAYYLQGVAALTPLATGFGGGLA